MLPIMWHHLLSKSNLFVLHSAPFISALYIVPRPVSSIDSSTPHPADSHQFKKEFVSSGEFEIITWKRIILLSHSLQFSNVLVPRKSWPFLSVLEASGSQWFLSKTCKNCVNVPQVLNDINADSKALGKHWTLQHAALMNSFDSWPQQPPKFEWFKTFLSSK